MLSSNMTSTGQDDKRLNAIFEKKMSAIEQADKRREKHMRTLKDAHTRMMQAVTESKAVLESGH